MDVVYKTILIEKRSRPHSGRQMFNKIMSRTFLDMVGGCYNANYKLDLKLHLPAGKNGIPTSCVRKLHLPAGKNGTPTFCVRGRTKRSPG